MEVNAWVCANLGYHNSLFHMSNDDTTLNWKRDAWRDQPKQHPPI
jgi:hypothetical protein